MVNDETLAVKLTVLRPRLDGLDTTGVMRPWRTACDDCEATLALTGPEAAALLPRGRYARSGALVAAPGYAVEAAYTSRTTRHGYIPMGPRVVAGALVPLSVLAARRLGP